VVAGAVAAGIARSEGPTLLLDLGTNGEAMIAAGGDLLAASAAAGPAFEGAGLSSGLPAVPGAIESAWLDAGELHVRAIGDEKPLGICGSGLLDLLAALLEAGALDRGGRLRPEGPLAARVHESAAGTHVDVADGVALTQLDVRAAQLAKAAVQVAVDVLVAEAGLGAADVREVVVAGAFGSHLRPASLAAIGVIPPAWVERVALAGNGALAGAEAMLVSSAARREAERVAGTVRTLPLAERPDFQERFLAALDFPSPATSGTARPA
jgi:uncharacterized 2Fe-2S/4Fe-4S cluster protein (DUF4445 family)